MKFCIKCKSIMNPVGEGTFKCTSCNFEEQGKQDDLVSKEPIKQQPERQKGVVDDKNIYATYEDFKCEKCGYEKAEVIERQPYISDEDSLTFLKCGKCGHTEQLARKTR